MDEYFSYDSNGEKLTPFQLFGDISLKKKYFYRGEIKSPILGEQEQRTRGVKRSYSYSTPTGTMTDKNTTVERATKKQKRKSSKVAKPFMMEDVTLLSCGHCKREFRAKATYRKQFGHFLVNHKCSGNERMQYVIGVKHRRCTFNCHPNVGCVNFSRNLKRMMA